MKILFLGLFYDEEGLQQSYRDVKVGVQMAPHRFQTLLIKGLEENGVEVQTVHMMPGGSFPIHHRKLVIKGRRWGKDNYRIGYLNLPIIKQLAQERAAYRYMKTALTGDNPPDYIVCYYLHIPFLKALNKIKKQFPKVKVLTIMTDAVPGRGDIVDTPASKKKGDEMVRLSKVSNGYALLTKYLAEPMEIEDKPYTVIEGIADEDAPKAKETDGKGKTFLYTGAIQQCYNLDTLINAFAYLPDATLWLMGSLLDLGGAEEQLKSLPNVHYLGCVPFEELQKYRDDCDYLINPRQPTGTYTKHSFPSKTMEYLACGKPVVGYWLEGIGEDYHPYINRLTGQDAKTVAEELQAIIDADYQTHKKVSAAAREFILEEKTCKKQAKKLIEILKEI